jgi:NarL family two-component system response regulator LiaR
MRRIRLLLADDHAILRQGTRELLEREPDFRVVGEAATGREAVRLAGELRPDVVIMDVRMPDFSGLEATRRIRELELPSQVLVLTAYDDDEYVFALLQAGAAGYLLKTAPIREVVQAVRQVCAGQSPLDPAVAHKVVRQLADGRPRLRREWTAGGLDRLTDREIEVLEVIAQGRTSNREIADELVISERTVQTHLSNIFSKMKVNSRTEAVLTALRKGWVSLG